MPSMLLLQEVIRLCWITLMQAGHQAARALVDQRGQSYYDAAGRCWGSNSMRAGAHQVLVDPADAESEGHEQGEGEAEESEESMSDE